MGYLRMRVFPWVKHNHESFARPPCCPGADGRLRGCWETAPPGTRTHEPSTRGRGQGGVLRCSLSALVTPVC